MARSTRPHGRRAQPHRAFTHAAPHRRPPLPPRRETDLPPPRSTTQPLRAAPGCLSRSARAPYRAPSGSSPAPGMRPTELTARPGLGAKSGRGRRREDRAGLSGRRGEETRGPLRPPPPEPAPLRRPAPPRSAAPHLPAGLTAGEPLPVGRQLGGNSRALTGTRAAAERVTASMRLDHQDHPVQPASTACCATSAGRPNTSGDGDTVTTGQLCP